MKKLLSVLISATLVLVSFIPVYAINVKINGQEVQYSTESGTPFVDQASRTQVPFRATMEAFGATVTWNKENQTAIAQKNGITVKVPIGENYIIKDGQQIKNDTAALIKDNRTYLPIRAVLEAFGANVSWNENTQSVIIEAENKSESTDSSKTSTKENKDSITYEEFKTLFKITQIKVTDHNEILYDADYVGNLDKNDFIDFWFNQNGLEYLEEMCKKLALDVQSKNPSYNIALYFKYNGTKLGYAFGYPGVSSGASSYSLSSLTENPFNIHNVNPI